VVLRKNVDVSPDALRAFLAATFSKWQLPDDFVFVAELPQTSTGKVLKSALRDTYRDRSAARFVEQPA
jgi:fatty-acyl-CoA synthase